MYCSRRLMSDVQHSIICEFNKGEWEWVKKAHSKHSSQAKPKKMENKKKWQCFDKLTHLHTHAVRVRHKQHLWFYLVWFGWKRERRAQLPLNTGPGSKSNTISLGTEWRRGLGVRDWYFRRQRISWFIGAVREKETGRQRQEDRHTEEMKVMGHNYGALTPRHRSFLTLQGWTPPSPL